MAVFADQTDLAGWNEPIGRWLPPMAAELNNARAALRWTLGPGNDPRTAGLVAAGFGRWGFSCGLIDEARAWIESALERLHPSNDSAIAARLWLALGTLTSGARRVEVCERACAIFRSTGDDRRLAAGYVRLGGGYCQIADYERAIVTLDDALSLLRQSGSSRSSYYAIALSWQGSALVSVDRRDEARQLLLKAVSIFEGLGDCDRAANERVNLAELEFAAGDTNRALEIVNKALVELRTGSGIDGFRLADSFQVVALQDAAAYSLVLGDTDRARAAARAALVQARGARGANWRAITIGHLAAIAALRGQTAVAAQLAGYVDQAFRLEGFHRGYTEERTYEILRAALASDLDEIERTRLIADGAALTEDQAVEMALTID
jgi:tetratricopeptide (TPR) repeat protein